MLGGACSSPGQVSVPGMGAKILWDVRETETPPNQKLLWGQPSGVFVTEKGTGTYCRVASGCSAEWGGRVESGQTLGEELPGRYK